MAFNTNKMEPVRIFNADGMDAKPDRRMWYGNPTNIVQLNDVKYGWALQIYEKMLADFWIPEKVDLSDDVNCYKELTVHERRVYDHILSYLTYLDSVQTTNIPHIKIPFTAPELGLALCKQLDQEALHVKSYQTMIEAVIEPERRDSIYDLWRGDLVLKERCAYIANLYQNYVDNPTPENYFLALVADYLLEGLYFYNGFQLYYNLASQHKMNGSADMFKYINKDEESHVRLYQKIIMEAMQVFPHSKSQIYELFDEAVSQEIRWTNHIMNNQILGMTDKSTEEYTKYLCNSRLKSIGLTPLYPGFDKNPYKHLDGIADLSKNATTKANFFETGVTNYQQSHSLTGWNF